MSYWHRLRLFAQKKNSSVEPGIRTFLKNLSIVTVCFAISKVFSSAATIIMARYLGTTGFGEAQVVLLVAQFLSLFMLFGLNVAIIRYGSAADKPEPVLSTSLYLTIITALIGSVIFWLIRHPLGRLIDLDDTKLQWALGLGWMFTGYIMLTSIYQMRNLFKQRGIIEVVFAALLLPGLLLGHFIAGRSYESMLTAYGVAYIACLPVMLWRFRSLFSLSWLFAPQTREILYYGGLALFSNVGYMLTFIVQPLQLQHAYNEDYVGLFRIYCTGSIYQATFATTIFYTVFFPKVSASKNKLAIWSRLTSTWKRAVLPLTLVYAAIQVVTVTLSGDDYPLVWSQIVFFSIASTLITIVTTYGQIITSQGVLGMRWGLAASVFSGILNYVFSMLLIPRYGISGAGLAIVCNYALTLIVMFAIRNVVLLPRADESTPASQNAD